MDLSLDLLFLTGDVVATIAVGAGIVLEIPKNPTRLQKFAMVLVVVGVTAETLFSVGLFVHDNAKIIGLETQLGSVIGQNTKLEKALDRQGKKITAADTRLDAISGREDALQGSLDDLGGDLDDITKGMGGLQLGQRNLASRQSGAEKRIADVTTETNRASASLAATEKEQRAFEEEERFLHPREIIFGRGAQNLKGFDGMPVFVEEWPGAETQGLADQLAAILEVEGWKVTRVKSSNASWREGVLIRYADIPPVRYSEGLTEGDIRRPRAAVAICRMLVEQGIQAEAQSEPSNGKPDELSWMLSYPPDSVVVQVGEKPGKYFRRLAPMPPPFDKYKPYQPPDPCAAFFEDWPVRK